MKKILDARRQLHVARASVFLIMVAVMAGMTGCVPDQQEYTPMVAASYHVVGLRSDGTAVAVGHNWWGQCNIGNWRHIIQVSAGGYHTVGLKSDNTVLAMGSTFQGQRTGLERWIDIIQVAVGHNDWGQCNVGNWTDVVQVAAGWYHTVGLRSDGTVVAVGYNGYGQCNVGNWTDIVQVSAGYSHTVGLKADGTVVAVGEEMGGQCEVGGW